MSSYRFWLILLFIFTIPTFYQLVKPGFFFMQDDLQAFRMHQMFACLKDLQIPCRWVPDMGYQYGYPQFLFYPPSVYYVGASLHFFGIQFIDSVKIMFILALVLSSLLMFLFLKDFFEGSTLPAFVGAALYTYVPYKALEVYVRGALSEFWSLCFYPLIFWSIYLLITREKLKHLIFLALSVALLLITHNLMTLIFVPVAAVWCISLLSIKKQWKILPAIICGGILAVGLATFFTLPVIFESKFAHLETLVGGYFDYRQHFVSLNRLFISNHFGYGSSGIGQDNDLTLSTGQIHWMVGLLAVVLAIALYKKNRGLSAITITLAAVELLVLFLIHQKSSLLWERIPILAWLQFPWRFLTDSIFLLSFLGACAIFFISQINQNYAKILAISILIGTLLLHGQFFKPKEWYGISDKDKFSGPFWEKELTISIFDYLPIYAKLPPNKKAPEFPETLEGQVRFINYEKGSDYQTGEIAVKKEATLRLPLFDFPGMTVLVDQKRVDHWHDDCRGQEYCLGLITFKVGEGTHKIEAKLENTPIRLAGNIITLVSFLIIIGLFTKRNEKLFT